MTRGFLSQPLAVFAVAMTVTLATVLVDVSFSTTIDELFKEGRAIELLSALWLLVAAVLWVALGTGDAMRRHWHVPVLLLLMAMREQDYDKRFLADGILKLRLYTGTAPLADKLIGLAVLALLAVCLWRLLRLSLPGWLAGLRRGQTAPWLVLGVRGHAGGGQDGGRAGPQAGALWHRPGPPAGNDAGARRGNAGARRRRHAGAGGGVPRAGRLAAGRAGGRDQH